MILVVGDIHFGINDQYGTFLDYQFNTLNWIYEIAEQNKVTDIVFLGDIFDKRRNINLRILDLVYKHFGKVDIPHHLLLGNHDVFYKNRNDVNSLSILFKNESIYTNVPTEIEIDNSTLLLTPWITSANYDESVSIIENSTADYMFGHLDLVGFEMNKGFISEKSTFNTNILKKFKRVLSGHYHIYSEQKNITYLGSVCQLNWNDYNVDKYIGLLDLESNSLELVKNPFTYYNRLIVKSEADLDIDFEQYRDKCVKLYLYVKRSIKIEKMINSLIEIAAKVFIIDEQVINNTRDINIDVEETEEITELWKKYLDETNFTSKDKRYIIKIFTDSYKKLLESPEIEL